MSNKNFLEKKDKKNKEKKKLKGFYINKKKLYSLFENEKGEINFKKEKT